MEEQVKSKQRVADHGEVFTPAWMVEAMLDPKLAATMMGKANIMKVEPLAKSLRKKAEELGFGAAIGATQEPYRVDLTGMANR